MSRFRKGTLLERYHIVLWCIIGGIAAVAFATISQRAGLSKINIMSEYLIHQYDYKEISYSNLFISVLTVRMPIILLILLGEKMTFRNRINDFVGICYGFSFVYVLYTLIRQYGVSGILVHFLLLSPHGIFYCAGAYGLMMGENGGRERKVFLTIVYVLGILLETYLNPLFVSLLIRLL